MHDPRRGEFYAGEAREPHHKRYKVGETLKLKGEEFEVLSIERDRIVLRPLATPERVVDLDSIKSDPLFKADLCGPNPRRDTWNRRRPWE